jgi:cytolysin-activating lysine-acyltransferase
MSGQKPTLNRSKRAGGSPVDAVVTAAEQALHAGKLKPDTAIPRATSWQPNTNADPLLGFGGFSAQTGAAFAPHADSQSDKTGQAGKASSTAMPSTPLPTDKTVSTVLGEITLLMTQSPQHKQLSIADLEWMVTPALLLRQFKLFYDTERNIPVGCVLFSKVSDAIAARLDAGGRLSTLDDWRSGETVRVMTTIAPFGGEVVL